MQSVNHYLLGSSCEGGLKSAGTYQDLQWTMRSHALLS